MHTVSIQNPDIFMSCIWAFKTVQYLDFLSGFWMKLKTRTKLFGFQIALDIRTVLHPYSFGPYEIWTHLVSGSPLYIGNLNKRCLQTGLLIVKFSQGLLFRCPVPRTIIEQRTKLVFRSRSVNQPKFHNLNARQFKQLNCAHDLNFGRN